jgi:hypothetical protein
MTDETGYTIKVEEDSSKKAKLESSDGMDGNKSERKSNYIREVSYMVLFIAAVFVINAMETGSYRTPWPVAVFTAVLGFGLLGYSHYLQSRDRN